MLFLMQDAVKKSSISIICFRLTVSDSAQMRHRYLLECESFLADHGSAPLSLSRYLVYSNMIVSGLSIFVAIHGSKNSGKLTSETVRSAIAQITVSDTVGISLSCWRIIATAAKLCLALREQNEPCAYESYESATNASSA